MNRWGDGYEVDIAETPRASRHISEPVYQTMLGSMYCGHAERVLKTDRLRKYMGQTQLVFTSPPFPLKTQKRYGNLEGDAYVRWFARFATLLRYNSMRTLPDVPTATVVPHSMPIRIRPPIRTSLD